MVKYLPGIYEAMGSIPALGAGVLSGQGPPQGVGSQAEMRPIRAESPPRGFISRMPPLAPAGRYMFQTYRAGRAIEGPRKDWGLPGTGP